MSLMVRLELQLPSWDIGEQGVFRSWWFDPLVATLAFGFFVNLYWYEERKRGLSSSTTLFLPLDGDCPQYKSLATYWIGIYIIKSIFPSPGGGILPDGIPHNLDELLYLVAEVASGILLYDFIFFLAHWALHEIPVIRSFHARHHSHFPCLEARDTLRHSVVDGSLQVLTSICVQGYTPWGSVKSRFARAIHNIVIIWMLTESHTASPVPYMWRRWCSGIRKHRRHHLEILRSDGNHHHYQQLFGYLDEARKWWLMTRKQSRKSM